MGPARTVICLPCNYSVVCQWRGIGGDKPLKQGIGYGRIALPRFSIPYFNDLSRSGRADNNCRDGTGRLISLDCALHRDYLLN
jgi:hypothetical protein